MPETFRSTRPISGRKEPDMVLTATPLELGSSARISGFDFENVR